MKKPTNPWRVPLLLGCTSLLLTATVVGVVVAAYWPKIRSLYRSASADMGDVLAVQAALQARYGTQVSVMSRHSPGAPSPVLVIQLVNPPFLEHTAEGDLAAKAREVALTAREALPAGRGYDRYEVAFTRQRGAVFTLNSRRVFPVDARDLPASGPTTPGRRSP